MMKCEIKEIEIAGLVPAKWNPREEITEDSVRSLADDIAKNGLLHNIGVWNDGESGSMVIAYGHRRVAAMKIAGIRTALAMVYSDCTEFQVRDLTRRENELRIGIDPLKDSELLGSMKEIGLTEQELAAHYGVPISTVCRRLKLVDLAPAVRELVGQGVKFTTDALEHLSSYPVNIQEKAVKQNVQEWNRENIFSWASFSGTVMASVRDLDHGDRFDDCLSCCLRTGASPDLFGQVDDKCLGQCLNPDCFSRHCKDRTRQRVADAVDPTVKERVKLNYSWQVCEKAKKDKPDAKNPCAYWCEENTGSIIVRYGPSEAERKKREKIEKERQAEKDEERKKVQRLRDECSRKMYVWFKKNFKHNVLTFVRSDIGKMIDVFVTFGVSMNLYGHEKKFMEKWTKSRTVKTLVDEFIPRIVKNMTEWKFRNDELFVKTFAFFKNVDWKAVFTNQELEVIAKSCHDYVRSTDSRD